MTNDKAQQDCTPSENIVMKSGSFNESFEGFSREEVQNCAEKFKSLIERSSSDKPFSQKEYKDISHLLEQKLFSFYLYKRNLNCNLIWKSSNAQNSDEIKTKKRKSIVMDGFLHKRRKLDYDYDACTDSKTYLSGEPCNTEYFSEEYNIMRSHLPHLNWCNLVSPTNKGRNLFPKWCQSSDNHLTYVPGASPSKTKPLQLRESKLKLKEGDKEKLKDNLIQTLKREMENNCYDENGIDEKLKNLSQIIKDSTLTNAKHFKGSSPLTSNSCNVEARKNQGDHVIELKLAFSNSLDQTPSSNLFDSLSEVILTKVRQLVATSQIYDADHMSSERVTEIVNNEGLVYLPNAGTALITSSGHMDIVVCFACGSAGRSPEDKMVFCNACCEPYHRYCLGFRITESNENSWTCSRCQKGISMVANVTASYVVDELRKIFDDSGCEEDKHFSKPQWKRRCSFCFKTGDLPSNLGGRLLYAGSNEWVHVNCILWSEGVGELKDGHLVNVRQTISASKSKYCSGCSRSGASLKCALRPCLKRFHFSCAMAYQCSFNKNMIYCPKHASILHRSNITSIFKVKRKIFASDPLESSIFNIYKKSITVGSLKLIGLKSGDVTKPGYRSRRKFWSTRDPERICTYFCSVFEKKDIIVKGCDKNALISERGNVESTPTDDRLDSDKESPLIKNLMKLKKLKMTGNKLCFKELSQLDGTAGFDDSDDDNDNSMSFHDFSDTIRFDEPHESINGGKHISSSQNHSKNSIISTASQDSSNSKLVTPNKSAVPFRKANPTPVKIFGGQVSYLGSVVATSLQSLLKPKQVQNVTASQYNIHDSHQQSLFKPCQNKIFELPLASSPLREPSNQTINFIPQISEQTIISSSSKKLTTASTNSIHSTPEQNLLNSRQNVETMPVNSSTMPTHTTPTVSIAAAQNSTKFASCASDNKIGHVQFLGSISGTKLQNLLKSKVTPSLLENNKFPNLPQMNLQITESSPVVPQNACKSTSVLSNVQQESMGFSRKVYSQKDVQEEMMQNATSSIISISGNTVCCQTITTSKNVDNYNGECMEASKSSSFSGHATLNVKISFPDTTSENQHISSNQITDSSSHIVTTAVTTGLLKPAIGFSNPQPFKNGELMFTDSEEEQEDSSLVGSSRVFSDFDDFVKNFGTKTSAISMPVLKLRRCDNLVVTSNVAVASTSLLSVSHPPLNIRGTAAAGHLHLASPLSSLPVPAIANTNSLLSEAVISKDSSRCSATFTIGESGSSNGQSTLTSPVASLPAQCSSETIPMYNLDNISKSVCLPSVLLAGNNQSNISVTSKEGPHNLPYSPISLHPAADFQPLGPSLSFTSPVTSLGISMPVKNPMPQFNMSLTSEPSKRNFTKPSMGEKAKSQKDINCHSANNEEGQKVVVFEIKSDDGFTCSGSSAEEAWSKVKNELDKMRHKLCLKPISLGGMKGMTFFGLDHPVIINLIQNHTKKQSDLPLQRRDPQLDVLEEVQEGCARFKPFGQRKPLDLFHFLLSEHRRTIKVNERCEPGHVEMTRAKSTISGIDLPLSLRYKNMQALSSVSTMVQRSLIHGRGLFAMRDIENGEMIIEYCGQIIRSTLTDAREKMYESKGIGCYMFRVDDSRVVDATMRGNAARFINHSCDPNCSSKIVQVDGLKHIVICATRTIRKGEELTYNYKFPIEEGNKIPCKCGSRKCKKFMN